MGQQRTKEDSHTYYTSGFLDHESSSDALHSGELKSSGCRVDQVERITYTCGNKFNTCSHVKDTTFTGFPASGCSYTNRSFKCRPGTPTGRAPEAAAEPSVFERLMPSGTREIAYDDGELLAAKTDAYSRLCALTPQQHMNALQSVLELKDTKQTLGGLLKLIEWAKKHSGRVLRKGPIAKRINLLATAGSIASAYLWYQFGVEPTASDVSRFIRELSQGKLQVRGKMKTKRLIYRKGQVLKAFYSVKPKATQVADAMFGNSSSPSNVSKNGCCTWSGKAHVVLPNGTTWIQAPYDDGSYNPSIYRGRTVMTRERKGCYFAQVLSDVELTGWEELQRRLAWNCPLATTMWELVPFSFLIDWVIDVGDAIRRLERRLCAQTYRSYLGPVWGWEREVVRRYQPALVRYDAYVSDLEAPRTYSNGGSLNLRWVVQTMPIEVGKSESFTRSPSPMPSRYWPNVAREVKAYQISSGMALLVQFASKLKR